MTLRQRYKLTKLHSSSDWYVPSVFGVRRTMYELTASVGARAGESECLLSTKGSRGRDLAFNCGFRTPSSLQG